MSEPLPGADRSRDSDDRLQLEEELLRLRDDLIAKDAELGDAKGRIAQMEAQIQGYERMRQELDAILHSRSWRLTQLVGAPLRKLRERKAR